MPWALFLSLTALLVGVPSTARADFSGPYTFTPPAPGAYSFGYAGQSFGQWTGLLRSGTINYIDTSQTPDRVVLNTDQVGWDHSAILFVRAAGSGTVSFRYTVAGEGFGLFGWFNNGSTNPAVSLGPVSGSPDIVTTPANGSLKVKAGDYFGFWIYATGNFMPPVVGRRVAAVQDFVFTANPPMLTSPEFTDGAFRFSVTGLTGIGSTVIYASSNLAHWSAIATNPPATNSMEIIDPDATNAPQRFYRAAEMR